MRERADIGSPWLPVVIITIASSGKLSIRPTSISIPSGMRMNPSSFAILTLISMLLPLITTFLFLAFAMLIICCILATLEAKRAMINRPLLSAAIVSSVFAISCEETVYPSLSTFVESDSRARTPCLPYMANLLTSVIVPSERL